LTTSKETTINGYKILKAYLATHQKKLCLINVSEMFLSGTVRDEASSLVDGIHPGIMQSKLLLHILKIIS